MASCFRDLPVFPTPIERNTRDALLCQGPAQIVIGFLIVLRTVDEDHAGNPRARIPVAWQTQLAVERPAVLGLEGDFRFRSQSLDIIGEPLVDLFG